MIIGSAAARHWFPDFRKPNDLDIISHKKHRKRKGVEIHWAEPFGQILAKYRYPEFAPPDLLYTIKLSHIFWNINWEKHIWDLCFFKRQKCEVDEESFGLLYNFWETFHGKKRANLNEANSNFFKTTVARKYEHDSLHEVVKHYDEPLYKKIKQDQSKAMVSRALFDKLDLEDQLNLVREEAYVFALERHLIPSNFKASKLGSYRASLKNLIVSASKGWFPKFIAMNYEALRTPPDWSFIDKFKQDEKEMKYLQLTKD